MKFSLCSFFLCLFLTSYGQNKVNPVKIDTNKLIQFSGVVVSEGDLSALPYTTVFDKTIRRGVISDYYGFFSMVAMPGDTLFFSYIGYKTSAYVIPDTLTEKRYSIIHMLQHDTLNLPTVTVYPWPSREDFARAFVDMHPYDDAIRRAQRELSGENLAFAAARLEGDAGNAYLTTRNMAYTKLYSNNQLPVNNLFNPYSWAKLIQDWKAGKLAKQ